jgi:transcriptional regulator with XRE-family HTH domain
MAKNATGFGDQLRARRKARGMTLYDVASTAGVSSSLVSMIERDMTSPSIRSLDAICKALDMPVSWLFDTPANGDPDEMGIVVRTHGRRHLDFGHLGMIKELLTPKLGGKLQFMLVTLQRGGTSGEQPYTHEGEEAGFVIAGSMQLQVGGRTFLLNEGDAFRFPSTTPHSFENAGQSVTRVLWAVTPPFY